MKNEQNEQILSEIWEIDQKQQISRNDWNEQILTNFQKRAFYHLLYLSEILPKWLKWTDFKDFQDIACQL